jgi:urease accessory protein UreH
VDPASGGLRARDRRRADAVGRHSRLELVFEYRRGRTVIAHAYAEPPFRVGPCFAEGAGVHLILASSAPGTFGGDVWEQSIRVDRGARVRLTSQSALQVHPSTDPIPARWCASYAVAEDAHLHCHWDAVIPFAGARLAQRFDVDVAAGGSLYWSDALMSGRQGRGEAWMFTELAHELRLSIGGTLKYLERYRLVPGERRLSHPWIASGASYFGTIVDCGDPRASTSIEALHSELRTFGGVRAAASSLEPDLCLVRLMAGTGPPFHALRDAMQRRRRTSGRGSLIGADDHAGRREAKE